MGLLRLAILPPFIWCMRLRHLACVGRGPLNHCPLRELAFVICVQSIRFARSRLAVRKRWHYLPHRDPYFLEKVFSAIVVVVISSINFAYSSSFLPSSSSSSSAMRSPHFRRSLRRRRRCSRYKLRSSSFLGRSRGVRSPSPSSLAPSHRVVPALALHS